MPEPGYCRERVAPAGSATYYGLLFAEPASRPLTCCLLALQYELNLACWTSSDMTVATTRLYWWLEELERLFAGQPRHPVTRELSALARLPGGARSMLNSSIDTALTSLRFSAARSYADWIDVNTGLCRGTWTTLAECAGPGAISADLDPAGFGGVLNCYEQLQGFPGLSECGRGTLPCAEDGATTDPGPVDNSGFSDRDYLTIVRRLLSDLETSERTVPNDCKYTWLFARIMNRIAAATCRELIRQGCHEPSRRLSLTPVRKLWIAWRTKQQAR